MKARGMQRTPEAGMDTPPIELVYFTGCPHVEAARASLRAALGAAGLPDQWREWDQTRAETPARVLGYGSPTVLVGGLDVTGKVPEGAGRACRADGVPTRQAIEAALKAWPSRGRSTPGA